MGLCKEDYIGYDLTNTEDLNECEELLLIKMSFLKKYGKDLFFADYMNSMSMLMNEMQELEQRRQEEERKRRNKQYKQLIKLTEQLYG